MQHQVPIHNKETHVDILVQSPSVICHLVLSDINGIIENNTLLCYYFLSYQHKNINYSFHFPLAATESLFTHVLLITDVVDVRHRMCIFD